MSAHGNSEALPGVAQIRGPQPKLSAVPQLTSAHWAGPLAEQCRIVAWVNERMALRDALEAALSAETLLAATPALLRTREYVALSGDVFGGLGH